jgi:hypothetical protein
MRKLLILIAGLAVTTLALVVPGTAKATQFNTWTNPDGLCMGVQGGNMTPGTAIIVWTCDGSLNQLWALDANSGANGAYLFRNAANTTECLSVFQMETTMRAPLVIWPCKDVSNNQDQRWDIPPLATTLPLRNWASNLVITPSAGFGSQLWLWDGRVNYPWTAGNFTNT